MARAVFDKRKQGVYLRVPSEKKFMPMLYPRFGKYVKKSKTLIQNQRKAIMEYCKRRREAEKQRKCSLK